MPLLICFPPNIDITVILKIAKLPLGIPTTIFYLIIRAKSFQVTYKMKILKFGRSIDQEAHLSLNRLQCTFVVICSSAILFVSLASLILTQVYISEKTTTQFAINPQIAVPHYAAFPNGLKLVSRRRWVAQPPVEPYEPLQQPAPLVIIHHTGTPSCSTIGECVLQVRLLQQTHIEFQRLGDIGYNFLVGGEGLAYDGRGWKAVGAHTEGYDHSSVGIALVGNFSTVAPSEEQIGACWKLIESGVQMGYIAEDYRVLGLRQVAGDGSNPGRMLFEEIQKWPHWAASP